MAPSHNRGAGRGRMTITEVTYPSPVRIDLVFEKPWKASNVTSFAIWSMTRERT